MQDKRLGAQITLRKLLPVHTMRRCVHMMQGLAGVQGKIG